MFARLTFINIAPQHAEEVKRIYYHEIVPAVKKQKGNIGAWLLEPTEKNNQYISLTEWVSAADGNVYETSGMYKKLVDKVRDKMMDKPLLKTYSIAETKVAATMK